MTKGRYQNMSRHVLVSPLLLIGHLENLAFGLLRYSYETLDFDYDAELTFLSFSLMEISSAIVGWWDIRHLKVNMYSSEILYIIYHKSSQKYSKQLYFWLDFFVIYLKLYACFWHNPLDCLGLINGKAFQQPSVLPRVDFTENIIRIGPLVPAAFQTLIQENKAITSPEKSLEAIPPPPAK